MATADDELFGAEHVRAYRESAGEHGYHWRGTTILLIDHDMGLVLSICDEVVVLDFGKVIFSGPPPAVRTDARVVEAYLGASAKTAPLRDPETAPGGARA